VAEARDHPRQRGGPELAYRFERFWEQA
jgi:hypothetical protein